MTKGNTDTSVVAIVAIIVGIVILLVPGVRCWSSRRAIVHLESEIQRLEEDNKERQAEIERRNADKTSQLVRSAEALKNLEHRLERNQTLAAETEEAQEKLALVKALIDKHALIRTEVHAIMGKFPELLSAGE